MRGRMTVDGWTTSLGERRVLRARWERDLWMILCEEETSAHEIN